MQHKGSGVWATDAQLQVDFPGPIAGLFKGMQSSSATNCFTQRAALFIQWGSLQLLSPVHHAEHCAYSSGYCLLPDNSSRIWEPICPHNSCFNCDFQETEQLQGEFTRLADQDTAFWISAEQQKSLTFTDARAVLACDSQHIVLSEQNFGIPEEQYNIILGTHKRRNRYVQPEQLASQLSAAQIATTMALSQLYMKECQRNIRVANPTLQARKLFNRENLQARWISETTIEVFHCVAIPLANISYRTTKSCYTFIPITVHLPNGTMDAFLDSEMRILSLVAHVASCSHHRYHHLQLQKTPIIWLRINSTTGKTQQLPPSTIHELYESTLNQLGSDLDLNPLTFHAWQLDNGSDIVTMLHIDEYANLEDFKNKLEQHSTARAEALGALKSGIKGWTLRWLRGLIQKLIDWWIRIACSYATFLLCRDVLIPCFIAYMLNPIRIPLMALVGFQRKRQRAQQILAQTYEDEPLHDMPTTSKQQAKRTATKPIRSSIRLNPSTGSAFFRARARAHSVTEDTPFGRTRPMRLSDE